MNKTAHDDKAESFYTEYLREQALWRHVAEGDRKALLALLNKETRWKEKAAAFSVPRLRSAAIVTSAMASRAAIRGGIPAHESYALADDYIKRAEKAATREALISLMREALADFCARVGNAKMPSAATPEIKKAIHYIHENLDKNLIADNVASHLGKSVSYLSQEFRRCAKRSLGGFILDMRLRAAQRLLDTSDLSVEDISEQLGFNCPSYFCRQFKAHFMLTPRQYRYKM